MWNSPTLVMPLTLFRIFTTRWPELSSTARSLPKSLIELAPFTPESASSTLSRMSCEKLKLIPGNSSNFSDNSFWISSRVIFRSQSLWPMMVNGTVRHRSIGNRGALNSTLK